jgi:uncharacterized membrane protein HdeD (DUF308 family)
MALQCNIDSKGKAARLIWGILLLIAGIIVLFLWPLNGGGAVAWIVTSLMILAGAFGIFEARAGWCVVRAMGFKTPM